jgi:hypothetical protein
MWYGARNDERTRGTVDRGTPQQQTFAVHRLNGCIGAGLTVICVHLFIVVRWRGVFARNSAGSDAMTVKRQEGRDDVLSLGICTTCVLAVLGAVHLIERRR